MVDVAGERRAGRERRHGDETLQLAHAQLRQLLEHSPAVLYVLKVEGDKVVTHLISESVAALLGFTVAEALADEWWAGQLHPDDRDRALNGLSETLGTGASLSEYRLRQRGGHYRWVEDSRRLIRDAAGMPTDITGVWTDITERKHSEEAVRQVSDQMARVRRKQVLTELVAIGAATAVIYYLAARFNWFLGATQWLLAHELDRLDEILFTAIFFLTVLSVFAFRRWRETESELTSRQQAKGALRLMHDELDQRVKQRTAELNDANQAFRTEAAERQRTETTLRETEEMFSLAFQSSPAAISIHRRRDLVYLVVNDAFLRLFEWERTDIVGRTSLELNLVEEASLQALRKVISETGEANNLELTAFSRTGRQLHVIISIRVIQFRGEECAVSTLVNITERKRAETALRESEAKFRQVVENIREVFWMADMRTHQILYVSPSYEAVWGRSCESFYSEANAWEESIFHEDRERMREAVATKQARGDYDETYRITRPDGAVRWIRDRASPIRDEASGNVRIVGTAEDITEYRTLEDQFRQAQKLEAVGTLAGGIAHDFNNILAAINGYTELARMNVKDNPRVREFLGSVLQASSRAADLVRQILTFSRQQPQERTAIKLQEVVAECFKLLRASIPSTVEFDLSLAGDAPTVLADATQIHQILMNLGTNAWHAMKDHPGHVDVKLERWVVDASQGIAQPRLRPGVYARISVNDTGCGMDQPTQRRIYEPFFTTKAPGEGTGLGLAVVHGIMDSHDGVVTVYSKLGEGTMFHLYFPEYAGDASLAPVIGKPAPRGNGERILFVDDEQLLVRLGRDTLEALGYSVEATTQPATALDMVRADPNRYALVLTDQTMPEMTGLSLAGQILQIRPGLPIILTTGYSASLTSERVKAAGIRQLLLKPTTLHTLGNAVHAALVAHA